MNSSINHEGQEALSISSFLSSISAGRDEISLSKTAFGRMLLENLRRNPPATRQEERKTGALPLLGRRIESQDFVDVYGRPRILTGWAAAAYILAWPTVIGVVIGFGLAIALFTVHNFSAIETPPTDSQPIVASLEPPR